MRPGTTEMEIKKRNPMLTEALSRRQICALETLSRLPAIFPALWSSPSSAQRIPAFIPETIAERQSRSFENGSLGADEHLSRTLLGRDHEIQRQEKLPCNEEQKTVLYLAYGSNLASETFLGNRGIRPLSQLNVYVPELKLTFDLPGIPYGEPCFAGTRFRDTTSGDVGDNEHDSENSPLVSRQDYHKDRWRKPLIGVVYEVTRADYAHIIATEGGGRGYQDVVVTCYPFPKDYNPSDAVPDHPDTTPFQAHTLLSPARGDSDKNSRCRWNTQTPLLRPDPCYAQPSARYLNLITYGAAEHNLPVSYRTYLSTIRPYRITTFRQRVGQVIFLALWGPLILLLVKLTGWLAGEDGRSPEWLVKVENVVFAAMWMSYDSVFRGIFGDGERTIEDV
ncbi:hypothetical protein VTN00DRAFT_3225 [Thermoascus crustaceus]|uniref:uncharacterized protein n=1 Tax=Thermoascus crustaceus TaxID=5088 RepID=UPI00374463F4